MTRSDWISLIAAIGTLLALIPSYHQFFKSSPSKTKGKIEPRKSKGNPAENNAMPGNSEIPTPGDTPPPDKPMDPFQKALGCFALSAIIFVIELVVYSWFAHWFGVKFDLITMPDNWRIGFFILFIIPGIMGLIGLAQFTSGFSD